MSSTSNSASPRWARVARERKYVIAGALFSLLFTFALVSHLSGADSSLLAFAKPVTNNVVPVNTFTSLEGQSDGLEKLLGPLKPSEESGFT